MDHAPTSVVLVPGFMLDDDLWDTFCPMLPEDWIVRKASLSGGNTIPQIARYIADNSPQQFVLVGFSLGGFVARQLAADYPDRVKALVLIASSLREDSEQQTKLKSDAIEALSVSTFHGLSSRSIKESLHPNQATDKKLIAQIQEMSARLGYEAFVTQSRLSRAGIPSQTIQCPTLVVASLHDKLRSQEEAEELSHAITNASLHYLNESGHMIPMEQPQELSTILINWLKSENII